MAVPKKRTEGIKNYIDNIKFINYHYPAFTHTKDRAMLESNLSSV